MGESFRVGLGSRGRDLKSAATMPGMFFKYLRRISAELSPQPTPRDRFKYNEEQSASGLYESGLYVDSNKEVYSW